MRLGAGFEMDWTTPEATRIDHDKQPHGVQISKPLADTRPPGSANWSNLPVIYIAASNPSLWGMRKRAANSWHRVFIYLAER